MPLQLRAVYRKLFKAFGAQRWWPADTPFEVMIGAILTQNTSWSNVEKAIRNLKLRKLLSARRLNAVSGRDLARLIRPTGYYNVKAKRIRSFLKFFLKDYGGSCSKMALEPTGQLRLSLLGINGIGPETADSILLYALNKPVFVIDSYTKRIFSRHRFFSPGMDYAAVQEFFSQRLPKSVKLYNEFHALIVRLGKDYCLKNKPRCSICPLRQ